MFRKEQTKNAQIKDHVSIIKESILTQKVLKTVELSDMKNQWPDQYNQLQWRRLECYWFLLNYKV